ncbi:MAG: sugar ABC transporter permease [Actinobacteria bacterium]|nr:MAG: sugar ABC transporter permease [Actinomycetota bacterium]
MVIVSLLPALALIGFFYLAPMIISIIYSFTNKTLVGSKSQEFDFVGISNYIFMFKDSRFIVSFINTLVFLIFSAVLGQQILGFIIAFLMQNKSKGLRKFVGTSVLLGWITPEVVVAFIFFAFFSVKGSLNDAIGLFGIGPIAWLFDFAMIAVIVANIWRGSAFSMLMYQAALSNVPDEAKESAMIDGANKFQVIFRIILPIIKGTIVTNTILVTIPTLGLFGVIFALTGGGPGNDTTTMPIYMYKQAFISYQIGYGTAMAIILLLLSILLSIFYIKSFRYEM